MTKIKLCGLSRPCDISAANALKPDYIGFVFAQKSRRYVTPERALALRRMLLPCIAAVGVFVNEEPKQVASLLAQGIIDIAQLHGAEDEEYIRTLRGLTRKPIMQAFRMLHKEDVQRAMAGSADFVLLDSPGGGMGKAFDWQLPQGIARPYFLAGGLTPDNVGEAIRLLRPYAVDVSSGIETEHLKDEEKMRAFVKNVRETDAEMDSRH